MVKIQIREPIWKEPWAVGVKVEKITGDLEVYVSYRNRKGKLILPLPMTITKEDALACPTIKIKRNGREIRLKRIPIDDMGVKL